MKKLLLLSLLTVSTASMANQDTTIAKTIPVPEDARLTAIHIKGEGRLVPFVGREACTMYLVDETEENIAVGFSVVGDVTKELIVIPKKSKEFSAIVKASFNPDQDLVIAGNLKNGKIVKVKSKHEVDGRTHTSVCKFAY